MANGTWKTFTAAEVAALHNVSNEPYLAVDLGAPLPFRSAEEELSYYHLRPDEHDIYFDAQERYNPHHQKYVQRDWDRQGKWATPKPRKGEVQI